MKPGDKVVVIKNLDGARALDGKSMLKPGDIIVIKSIRDSGIRYELHDGYENYISLEAVRPLDKNIKWKKVSVKTGKFN